MFLSNTPTYHVNLLLHYLINEIYLDIPAKFDICDCCTYYIVESCYYFFNLSQSIKVNYPFAYISKAEVDLVFHDQELKKSNQEHLLWITYAMY